MSFNSVKEIVYFFKKKACPGCGNKNMKRHFHKKYIGAKRSVGVDHLGYDNSYETTAVYECVKCNEKYTLEGLMNNRSLEEMSVYNQEGESKLDIESRDQVTNRMNAKHTRKVFLIIGIVTILIVGTSILRSMLS